MSNFPIEEVRSQFPALKREYKGKPVVYFDGPGGSQTVQSAIDAIHRYLSNGCSNLHADFPTSRETEALIAESRNAVATLFNAKPHEVAFGPNATTLMCHVSRAIARQWKEGDEIVLTQLEHHSNIDTWRRAAEDKGVTVKYIPLDVKNLTLDLSSINGIITEKTKLVAVGLASNCVGTITDISPIVKRAREVGAVVSADAVHAIPHIHVDMKESGIDMLFSSVYKFFGPHVGMAVIKEDVFEKLDIYKVAPAPSYIPDKLETGTQNHEGVPAVKCSVDFIASLGEGATLSEKIKSGYRAIEEHENSLAEYIRVELAGMPEVTLYQAGGAVPKTPTIAFQVKGISPRDFCIKMCEEHSVFIADGDFYAKTLADLLGISESGAFIRAGMAPYNTMEEAKRFVDGVGEIIKESKEDA